MSETDYERHASLSPDGFYVWRQSDMDSFASTTQSMTDEELDYTDFGLKWDGTRYEWKTLDGA